MKILKLSITLLDKLGHIQVKHADIYNMEKFQEFSASKRNQEAELGRYPGLQIWKQGRGEENSLKGDVRPQTFCMLDPVREGSCFFSLFCKVT